MTPRAALALVAAACAVFWAGVLVAVSYAPWWAGWCVGGGLLVGVAAGVLGALRFEFHVPTTPPSTPEAPRHE